MVSDKGLIHVKAIIHHQQ